MQVLRSFATFEERVLLEKSVNELDGWCPLRDVLHVDELEGVLVIVVVGLGSRYGEPITR